VEVALENVRGPEDKVNKGGVVLQTVRGRMRMRAPNLSLGEEEPDWRRCDQGSILHDAMKTPTSQRFQFVWPVGFK
jgi:hypothetical protein